MPPRAVVHEHDHAYVIVRHIPDLEAAEAAEAGHFAAVEIGGCGGLGPRELAEVLRTVAAALESGDYEPRSTPHPINLGKLN